MRQSFPAPAAAVPISWFSIATFFFTTSLFIWMVKHRVGPFRLMKMVGVYGHAAWLMTVRCSTVIRVEVRRNWKYILSEADKRSSL